jgi:hypothetical protein
MSSFYSACLLLVTSALVGCASAPKPTYTDADYKSASEVFAFSHACGAAGRMPLETAALGKHYVEESLGAYQVDMDRLNQAISLLAKHPSWITPEKCNETAIFILAIKSKRDDAKSTAAANSQPYTPRFIDCSTNFGQTFCTSY